MSILKVMVKLVHLTYHDDLLDYMEPISDTQLLLPHWNYAHLKFKASKLYFTTHMSANKVSPVFCALSRPYAWNWKLKRNAERWKAKRKCTQPTFILVIWFVYVTNILWKQDASMVARMHFENGFPQSEAAKITVEIFLWCVLKKSWGRKLLLILSKGTSQLWCFFFTSALTHLLDAPTHYVILSSQTFSVVLSM